MSGIRRDVRNQKTGDTVDRLENAMMQLLDTLQAKSYKSSRSTSMQPKALESAPPEVKAGGSKEVPIALESNMEEINLLREGETKPKRWSTEKPNLQKPDPPKKEKSKPPKGKGVNNNGRSADARKSKGNTRNGKPAWNKDGQPLCFNYGKYGHMAKDCPKPHKERQNGNSSQNNRSNSSRNPRSDARSGSRSEEQFIPEGLGDLYRSNGGTFSAHIDEQQLQDLMQWYDETLQRADCPEATATEEDNPMAIVADCPEPQVAEYPEAAAAADCTDCTETESPERPELQATQSPELQGTDCPELRLQATESPGLQAIDRAEVDSADSFVRIEPQVADCPEATKSTVVGSAMLLYVHFSMEDDRDKLL
ncbi:hypothetical protein DL765_006698 [Monosporascus sp. GIB2]|nr:hypothetical protein DL765_006698 [Monosporascus sp. GIB2]